MAIVVSVWSLQAQDAKPSSSTGNNIAFVYPIEIGTITICHRPPGNPTNERTLTIGYSALSSHEGHGDTLGPCVEAVATDVMTPTVTNTSPITVTPTITSSATSTVTQTFTPTLTPTTTLTVSPTVNGVDAAIDSKVTICHRPPGNPANAHTITVGYPALSAHSGHGDTLGPCSSLTPTLTPTATMTITATPTLTTTIIPTMTVITATPIPSTMPTVAESKATICHRPPGNPSNAHTISVGESAVPAHIAHGDSRGSCPQNQDNSVQQNNGNNGNGNGGNGNTGKGNSGNNGKGKDNGNNGKGKGKKK